MDNPTRGVCELSTLSEFDFDGDPAVPSPDPAAEGYLDRLDNTPFTVDNDRKAAWAMRKLREHRMAVAEIDAIAAAEHERIDQWRNQAVARHANDIDYFEALLTGYAAHERAANDRKSIDLPYGKVLTRATPPKFLLDEEALLPWARENRPDWVKVVESVALSAMKADVTVEETTSLGLVAMTTEGEIVPGVAVEPGGVSIRVEVAK